MGFRHLEILPAHWKAAAMSGISLRPYQQEAIRAVQSEWRTGHYRTLLIMPEGAGSELCIIALAYAAASRGERFLVLVHNVLCVPRYMDLISELPGRMPKNIAVMPFRTRSQREAILRIDPDSYGCIAFDEAHASTEQYMLDIIGHFGYAKMVGITAEASATFRKRLLTVWDSLAYEYRLPDAIQEIVLCPIYAQVVPLDIDIEGIDGDGQDYPQPQMQIARALIARMPEIADAIESCCHGRRSTVVYLPYPTAAQALSDMLCERGIRSCEVDTKNPDFRTAISDFSLGIHEVCCTSMDLCDGWDLSRVDCVVMLFPTRNAFLYSRMASLGTRWCEETDKEDLLLIDFTWKTGRAKVCSPATLIASSKDEYIAYDKAISSSELPVNLAILAGASTAGRYSDTIALEAAAEALPSADLLDPREFMRLMSGITLYEYEPRQRWEFLSATSNQKSLLRMYGFNTHALSRGLAKQLIETVITRDNRRMATPLQMHELADYGFSDVAQWSSGGAAWMLGEIEGNGGRIPSNIDPATYKPC